MKSLFNTIAILFLSSAAPLVKGAVVTVGPSDCSAAAVNAAISASSTLDGDTVQLTCTGSITWTSTVTIPSTKGITLQVKGATNTPKSAAAFPLRITSNQSPAIVINVGPNHAVSRISGFYFAPNSGTADPFLEITGHGTGTAGLGGFRLDNNYFDTISAAENVAVWSKSGSLFGLIDNNTFHNVWRASSPSYGPYNIQVWNYWHPSGSNECWGCDGWTNNDFAYGSAKSVFIEDNLFEQTATARGHMRHYISAELGARYVARYNTFVNDYPDTNADDIDAHGLCLVASNGAGARGGEIYDNTFLGSGYDRAMVLRGGSWLVYDNVITNGNAIQFFEYRAGSGQCSTNNALGLMPPWPVPAGAKWGANDPWVASVTDGSHYPLPQQIFNTYLWNNRTAAGGGGNLINPSVYGGFSSDSESLYIQANRDYFSSSTKPDAMASYTPYTYPHPLRGSNTTPNPPTDLTVSAQ